MSKLLECLSKLQSINDDNTEYSIALAQDIEAAKSELWKLSCMALACAEDYPETTTNEEHMLLDEIAAELVDYQE